MSKWSPFWLLFPLLIHLAALPMAKASAQPGPFIDARLTDVLHDQKIPGSAMFPVVVFYSRELSPQISAHGHSRVQMQKAMMENTRKLEDEILPQRFVLHEDHKSTLWVANATSLQLRKTDLLKLTQDSRIASVFFANKKISLPRQQFSARQLLNFPDVLQPRRIGNGNFTDGLVKLNLPKLRQQQPGLLGQGVRVGILDSGIDAQHPDLVGRVKLFQDFSSEQSSTPNDLFEHGTHVAGTISGGAVSGMAIGVAPEVQLIVGKIFDRGGESQFAQILKAMQWMADPDGNPDTADFPRVVNSSWGDSDPYDMRDPQDDPFCRVVDSWVQLGILPVFSAGNSGSKPGSIGLPAGCPQAFAVAAVNTQDQCMWFSSAGPAIWKSMKLMKPEISAPGFEIISARPGGGYQTMSGTSMAAPHITGAFALLFQLQPNLSVQDAQNKLIKASQDLGPSGQDPDFGWGRPDFAKFLD